MTNDMTGSAAATSRQPAEYEFDVTQELVVGELAGAMRFVGTATTFMGNPAGLAQIIQGVLMAFIGVWTRSSARSFQLVVDTKGNDIGNLMNALGELRRLYNLQRWVLIVALVLMVVAFALGILAAIFLRGHSLPA